MKDDIKKYFPEKIKFPDELEHLCDWVSENGYPISGYFELCADDGEWFYHWFGSHAADDKLALFGTGPDGSLYAVWLQGGGRQPIVHLGSEGDNLKVLAASMLQFIALLAIGYGEIGHDDLSKPPKEIDDVNPKFQNWVKDKYHIEIPQTGDQFVKQAIAEHDDFEAWVATVPSEDG
ncbi:MAG: hypothetical protein GY705_19065 [Bacteroidetes bacterium]|nr:hypothetical protein [Bacteroidota bacterium]